jgi:hypothetical protein
MVSLLLSSSKCKYFGLSVSNAKGHNNLKTPKDDNNHSLYLLAIK